MKKLNRIHIVGIYGSGKSTFAKKINEILKYKVYDLDKIKYKRKYDKIRSVEERLKIVKEISDKKNWITEGAWLDYALELYKKADLVIFFDVPKNILYKRIWIRYLKRKISKEKYFNNNLKTTLKIIKIVRKYFHDPNHFMTLKTHKDYIRKNAKKVLVIKTNQELNEFLDNLK